MLTELDMSIISDLQVYAAPQKAVQHQWQKAGLDRLPHMLSIHGMDLIGRNLSGTTDVAVVTRQARLIN